MILNEFFNLPQVFEKDMEEGIFGSKPNPVLPIVAKIDKVARELNPQNVEVGKQIIQSQTRDITRMLSPQDKAGVDVIEQDELEEVDRRGFLKGLGAAAVAGAAGTGVGYEIGKKEKTSKLQMPSNPQAYFLLGYVYNMISGLMLNSNTEMSKWSNEMFDLHSQAKVEVASSDNNNLEMSYHKGTKAARDTINEIKGWNNYPIDPTGKAAGLTQDQAWEYDRKFRNDKEIARQIENKTRPYYDKLMKMVRQNNSVNQGVSEAKDDYVPPKEANYDDKYQAMVRRVGQKAKTQEKAKQQQPKAPVRESRLALLKQIIQS